MSFEPAIDIQLNRHLDGMDFQEGYIDFVAGHANRLVDDIKKEGVAVLEYGVLGKVIYNVQNLIDAAKEEYKALDDAFMFDYFKKEVEYYL